MTNEEIFNHFEKQHAYSFSTINNGYPDVRVAHFNTFDNDGLYFMTMKVKPFYRQLKENSKVAVMSLVSPESAAAHGDDGMPLFPPGYFIRLKGDVRELSSKELKEKTVADPKFLPLVKDMERYPTMTTFVLYSFSGELYDYDFEKITRPNKLDRTRFAFGGAKVIPVGFSIDKETCIACGSCYKVCSFLAIQPGEQYSINGRYCDECGSCYSVCPVGAIRVKSPVSEEERKIIGQQTRRYYKANPIH